MPCGKRRGLQARLPEGKKACWLPGIQANNAASFADGKPTCKLSGPPTS
jgi:hypothetical protein